MGSTGSIGTQALQIAKAENLPIEVLCAGENIDLLNAQIAEFRPKIVVIKDSKKRHLIRGANRVLCGESGILEALNLAKSKLVLNALVGFSGVKPSLESIARGKTLALANKESLVVAGFLMGRENLAKILPVDSEHFALKELILSLRGARSASKCNEAIHESSVDCHESAIADSRNDGISVESTIKKLIITASGGAFRDLPLDEISRQSAKKALNHPTWAMGRKITIDSATMINKLFEILEAQWLFGAYFSANLGAENITNIDAVIERTSTIHALIQTADNAIIAHLSSNDMRLPIASALLGAKAKRKAFIKELDLLNLNLRFEKIDINRYPLWTLKDSLLKRPKLGVILNAANDILVEQFLNDEIIFGDIAKRIFKVVERFGDESSLDLIKNIADIMEINTKIADFLRYY